MIKPDDVDAAMYHRVFVDHVEGAAILEALVRRFYATTAYTAGGIEAVRETDRKLGNQQVINWINRQISIAWGSDPNDFEEPT